MDVRTSIQTLNECKNETLDTLLKDMKNTNAIPTVPVENGKWLDRYEKWTSILQKSYNETLQKENLEEAYSFNRKMSVVARGMSRFAHGQANSYLYAMGMFAGVFSAMASMLPKRNKEQILNITMAGLKNRTYVKAILENLYESDYLQHKELCERVCASPSQLNRTMESLIDSGCIKRYKNGKYSLYSLTPMGRKYTKEFLGYTRKDYMEYSAVIMAGKKPQIVKREQENRRWRTSVLQPTAEYRIGDSVNDVYKSRYGMSVMER